MQADWENCSYLLQKFLMTRRYNVTVYPTPKPIEAIILLRFKIELLSSHRRLKH